MNWFGFLEQKKKLLIGGIVIICLAMLAVTARRYNVSFDSFWHVKIGLDWLEHGLNPLRDHYSFTFNGSAVGVPWLFDITLGWLVMHFGLEPGLQIFKFASFALVFLLVFLFLRMVRASALVYCLVLPLLVVMLQLRASVRPELISYSFIVLSMMLYYRARSGLSLASMLPVLMLMLIWSNYHSPVIGYVIFVGFFIDAAFRQWQERASAGSWLRWLGWGLAVVAVGFLKPGFDHPLIALLTFSPEWKELIQEYQSALLYKGLAASYALIFISLVTLALTLKKRQFGLFFVCAFLLYSSLEMVRLVAPSGIVILCVFAWMMSEIGLDSRAQRLPDRLSRSLGASALVLFALSLTTSVNLARAYMQENKTSWAVFPGDVVDYMIDEGISGRIFNPYDLGGYLIYRLSPDSQVYIDGRTGILYPIEHMYRHMDAEIYSAKLSEEIEKYDIRLSILENSHANYSIARDTGQLGLDYPGSHFSLFRTDSPNFPVLGSLLAYPACWSSDLTSALVSEHKKAITLLPEDSGMFFYLRYVIDYDRTEDKHSFLAMMEGQSRASDDLLRFAGHQAIVQNQDSSAFKLFEGIRNRVFSDYLGGALAAVRMGEWETAEEMLDVVTRFSFSEKPDEIFVLHDLLTRIRQHSTLNKFNDAYISQLAEKLGENDRNLSSADADRNLFCPGI